MTAIQKMVEWGHNYSTKDKNTNQVADDFCLEARRLAAEEADEGPEIVCPACDFSGEAKKICPSCGTYTEEKPTEKWVKSIDLETGATCHRLITDKADKGDK